MLKRRLQRLVRVYTCQNATLLEISCTGSYVISGAVEDQVFDAVLVCTGHHAMPHRPTFPGLDKY